MPFDAEFDQREHGDDRHEKPVVRSLLDAVKTGPFGTAQASTRR